MRFRPKALVRVLGGTVLVAALAASPGMAQGGGGTAVVDPVQGLQFGQLVPGMTLRVGPEEVGQRGELHVEGTGQYQVQFLLPEALVSLEGRTIPLVFGATDGILVRGTAGTAQVFDPRFGIGLSLTGGVRDARIFLGGTVEPAPGQASGMYLANITVLVARN
jgi:hypothetical protein